MSKPDIPSREVVESLCLPSGGLDGGCLAFNEQIWIKYGAYVKLHEAAIQQYVHDHADPCVVRVPKVYDAFTLPRQNAAPITYIVMENIQGDDFVTYSKQNPEGASQALEAIEKAVRHIWEIPLPPTARLGPFGQEYPADRFFSDYGAERHFNNVVELEDWINSKLEEAERLDRVALKDEPLCICHCNLTLFNIKVGETIAILD